MYLKLGRRTDSKELLLFNYYVILSKIFKGCNTTSFYSGLVPFMATNLSHINTNDSRAKFWLQNVARFADGSQSKRLTMGELKSFFRSKDTLLLGMSDNTIIVP